MKKIFTVLFVAAVMVAMPAQAQLVKFGVRGGLNVSSMKFNESVFESSNKAGWFIGPTLQVSLPIGGLGADISAFYDQKNLEVNDESVKQKSIVVPVNVRWKFGLGSMAGIYLAAGPQFGFNVGDDYFSWTDMHGYNDTFQMKKSNFSLNLGAGAYITKHVEVGFAYNIGLGKTGEVNALSLIEGGNSNTTKDNTKANTWQISAAYFF